MDGLPVLILKLKLYLSNEKLCEWMGDLLSSPVSGVAG
jgi:hypothetical protein